MSDLSDPRLKRLVYRSRYTGTKELDVLLTRFVSRHLGSLTADQVDRYERLLTADDPDLYHWISGYKPVPPEWDDDIMRLLRQGTGP